MHGVTDGVWAEEAQLPREILDSLRDLNLRFLNLSGSGNGAYRRLPAHDLSAAQCEAVARCPYALFDLNFGDDLLWQLRLDGPRRWEVADDAGVDPPAVEFARLALFFAWHAVRVHGVSAQLTLGLSPVAVRLFRGAGFERLPALAPGASLQLAPRWRHSSAFWGRLFKAAASRDPSRLERVQLYGVQLAAAVRLRDAPTS